MKNCEKNKRVNLVFHLGVEIKLKYSTPSLFKKLFRV